jgi:hypothetical protein
MDAPHEPQARTTWGHSDAWPTAKQRTGVQHAVRRLLDALAPEVPPPRFADARGDVQRVRSPRGCILQGEACAVTVSWFPGGPTDVALGELQVIAWSGTVSRPGAARRTSGGGARPVAETLLSPVESPGEAWAWRAADGTVLDMGALVARCLDVFTRPVSPVPATA